MKIKHARKGFSVSMSRNEIMRIYDAIQWYTDETADRIKNTINDLIDKEKGMSKGSNRRPQQVDDKTVENNWDRIFKSTAEDPIPTGKVNVFGKSERGYSLISASIYPDKYEAVNDTWLMTCEVSRHDARWGHFSNDLGELIKSGVLQHEGLEREPMEISEDIIEEVKQWAKDNGVVYK